MVGSNVDLAGLRSARRAGETATSKEGTSMGELTVTTFVSVDGVMQAPGAPKEDTAGDFRHGGWVFPHADPDMGSIVVDIFSRADAFLLGRGTYDIFAAHWPRVTDPNDPIAARLNALPKHVASRSRADFPWQNTSPVRDVTAEVVALKERYAREIQVHGSAGLLQTLLGQNLIDELRVLTFPVILGTGKRLFAAAAAPGTLTLKDFRVSGKGVVYCAYRRAGPVRTGSFALE
jgi:dihydrofolate reductase